MIFQTDGEFELFSWLSAFNKSEAKLETDESENDSDPLKTHNTLKGHGYTSGDKTSSDEKSQKVLPIKVGMLSMKEVGFLLPIWKKRYIALTPDGYIKITKNQSDKPQKKNVFNIRTAKCVQFIERGKFLFDLVLDEKHSLSFRANSESELADWVNAVTKVIQSHPRSGSATLQGATALHSSTTSNPFLTLSDTEDSKERMFGVPLDQVMKLPIQKSHPELVIPVIVDKSLTFLQNHLEIVGLFRVNGDYDSIKQVKKAFNSGKEISFHNLDCAVVCGLLKMFLRELPTPLLTFQLYPQIIAASKVEIDHEPKIAYLKQILEGLPEINRNVTISIFSLLHQISLREDKNKMGASNLATVMGPNLLWSEHGLQALGHVNKIVEFVIQNYPEIFDDYSAYDFATEENQNEDQKSQSKSQDHSERLHLEQPDQTNRSGSGHGLNLMQSDKTSISLSNKSIASVGRTSLTTLDHTPNTTSVTDIQPSTTSVSTQIVSEKRESASFLLTEPKSSTTLKCPPYSA